jgi:DNA invertase Pin-like site-specific DNA recombinase
MKVKRVAIYVRVSTAGQNTRTQESELRKYAGGRGWAIHQVYRDEGFSGARVSRPALDQLLHDCQSRRVGIDIVLVWKFDRFARSLRALLSALETFRALGIDFCSATEPIDTTMPHGELVFQILSAVAQWERNLIGERVRAGIDRAKKDGVRFGRPPLKRLSRADMVLIRKQRDEGKTFRALAAEFGTSVWTAHQVCGRG